jgi:hypothetical protein
VVWSRDTVDAPQKPPVLFDTYIVSCASRVKRTLLFSLPLLFACSSSDPASPFFGGVSRDDGGATFLDGSADGPTNPNPTSDASTDGSTSCISRGGDGGAEAGVAPSALVTAMNAAMPGDVVALSGLDTSTVEAVAVSLCPVTDAPTLLFSNSPETPDTNGILYADTVAKGRYRLYVYQVNGGNQQRKFPIVVYNPAETGSATVKILRRGLATPSTQYLAVGKSVLADWLTPKTITDVVVAGGQRAVIATATAQKNELVHAIFDIETTAEVKLSFVSILANANPITDAPGFSLLPAEIAHDRGTFPNADVALQVAAGAQKSGVQRLRLGANEIDANLQGFDRTASPSLPVTLRGNFGVRYRIELATSARAAITPRGGAWGGYAHDGTMAIALPSATAGLATSTDAIVLGPLGPTTKPELMSAGGASLPIDLFLLTP